MSLKDAVHLALDKNKSVEASAAARKAAESRIAEARGGNLPKVNYSESWARSDNPVFVFSSLLTQHQFGEQNFQIGPLNRPDFLNNFQSQLTADQTLYDAGQTKHAVRSAELTKDITERGGPAHANGSDRRRDPVLLRRPAGRGATQCDQPGHALGARPTWSAPKPVRSAGMSTDVDVLSIRVHLAGVREQQIRRAADLDVARAALNDALGPAARHGAHPDHGAGAFATPGRPAGGLRKATPSASRPEARQVKLATSLAENQAATARSNLLPQVGAHAAFEADRQHFYDKGGANWLVSIGLRWNLFNGFSDKARIEESKFALRQSEAEQEHADSAIRLQVRRAYADLRAAAAAHRSGQSIRRGSGRESSHHPEPLRNRAEQCHRPASHGDGGARSADPASGGDPRSAHRRGDARTGGRDADGGFGGSELNDEAIC